MLSRLCVHTITNKPWSFEYALEQYCKHGIAGVSIWQHIADDPGLKESIKIISQYPIEVVSYVRGGFFAHPDKSERRQALEENFRRLEEAAGLGAPLLVLVCGAHPDQSLSTSRAQIQSGIERLVPYAEELNIKLGIEPLHPMYAHSRSAINTMKQANDMIESIDHHLVGAVLDVYHVWWEAELEHEIQRCGQNQKLFAYHICDWKSPQSDFLNDRGLMGDGCIDLNTINAWINEAGFDGYYEVEIFSHRYWSMDQHKFLDKILERYRNLW